MSKEEFVQKYRVDESEGNDPHWIFWLRSYQAPQSTLCNMSADFLSIPGITQNWSSSVSLAKRNQP